MLRLTGSWSQTKYCLITTRLLPTLTTAPPPVITSNIPSNGEHVFVLRRNVSNGDGGGGEVQILIYEPNFDRTNVGWYVGTFINVNSRFPI